MRSVDPRVREHLRPARRPLAGLLAAGVVQSLLVVAQAFVLAGAVVAVVRHQPIGGWASAVAVVLLGRAAVSFLADLSSAYAASAVGQTLRSRVVHSLLATDQPGSGSTGSTVLLATRGVSETKPYLVRYLPALVLAVTLPPISMVAIAVADPLSGLIVLLTVPLIPVFAALIGSRTREHADRQWRQLGSLAGHFVDVMRGLPTLVVFRRAQRQVQVIREVTHRYRRASLATLRLAFASSAVLELVATLSVALVAVTVGLRLAAGHLGLGTAMFVLLLAPEVYWPIRRAGAEFHAAAAGTAAFEQADEILTAADSTDGCVGRSTAPGLLDIRLDDVSVIWGDGSVGLAPTSQRWPSSGLVAVCGPSGVGKTTLLSVVRGQVAPTTGSITVGATRLGALDMEWWRRQVAWLPQRPVFVAGTVADNLRLGRDDATETELWAAVSSVGLSHRIGAMAGGLSAPVEQDGRNLSAGERARLAVARVLISRRPVVLLDEPTAHLDVATEHELVRTLADLADRALVVAVTHREALVEAADLVTTLAAPDTAEKGVGAPPAPIAPRVRPPRSTPGAGRPAPTADSDDPASTGRRNRSRMAVAVLLGALASLSGIALTATAAWLIVKASSHPAVLTLLVAIVAVRMFGLARPAFRYAERLWSHDVALRALADQRAEVYAALIPLTPARLSRRRGTVLSELVDDVEASVDRRLRVMLPLWTTVVAGLAAAALAAIPAPQASLVDIALVAVAGIVVVVTLAIRLDHTADTTLRVRRRLAEQVTALVEARDELVAWGADSRAVGTVDDTSADLERLVRRTSVALALGRAGVVAMTGAAVAATLLIVAPMVDSGQLSAAMAALLVLLPVALGELLQPGPDIAAAEVQTRHALRRLTSVTELSPLVQESESARPVQPGPATVELHQVTAGWGDVAVLSGLDASWAPGRRIGIVGASGSGKSTVAALLVRFLDPTAGAVRFAGDALADLHLDDVRRTLCLLDDDPHVFATSVAENVRLAAPQADDAQVRAVLESAGLGPWVAALPDGIATLIGEGHREVSGGERARLGIARLLLADPDVFVLDEPTAQLDASNARRVLASVHAAAGNRTVVLVSHRSADLSWCDEVMDLDSSSREVGVLRHVVVGHRVAIGRGLVGP